MNHMSCIGFAEMTQDELAQIIDRAMALAVDESPNPSARHPRWTDSSGASLAFHVNDDGEIMCMTPFFEAPSPGCWRLRTTAPADDPDCPHCGGADCDVLAPDPSEGLVTRAAIQWLHFQRYRDWLSKPHQFACEVVAFADRAAFCPTSEAFRAKCKECLPGIFAGGDPGADDVPRVCGLDEVSFIPTGMFEKEHAFGARATALFAGRVKAAKKLTNTLVDRDFWHVRVDSLPGVVDVVCCHDPETETEADAVPELGSIALVKGWLVGRPTEPPPHRPARNPRGWLARLFSR